MLRSLRLSATISTALLSSLFFFPTVGVAQDSPDCFIVKSSGQVVDLDNLCQRQAQDRALQKVRACQGPFDSDGFPLALYSELEDFKTTITDAEKKRKLDVQIEDVAIEKLLAQVSFPAESRKLQQRLKLLSNQLQSAKNSKEVDEIIEEYNLAGTKLMTDSCYFQIMKALKSKSLLF